MIVNVPEKIKNLLLISKLNTVFTIKYSVDKANEILTNSFNHSSTSGNRLLPKGWGLSKKQCGATNIFILELFFISLKSSLFPKADFFE